METATPEEVEAALLGVFEAALVGLAGTLGDARVRAVVLHSVDAEEEGVIGAPLLAVDTDLALATTGRATASGFGSARFHPEDFRWPEVDVAHEPLLVIERLVTEEACRGDVAHWHAALSRYEEVLVGVAGALARRVPDLLPVTDDLAVFVYDPTGGPDLARRTIPDDLFARLFPEQLDLEQQRRAVAALPEEERVAFYLSRLREYEGIDTEEAQGALVALGAPAVNGLVGLLGEKERGWVAAELLGKIGLSSEAVVAGLRAAVAARGASADWSAMALGALGDFDHLLGLAADADTFRFAALGVTAPLLAWFPWRPLDYGPLERLLDGGGAAAERAGQELKPGRPTCTISAEDAPVALAALASPHRLVRSHAVRVLGNSMLGAKRAPVVLEALVGAALGDEDPVVRRMAALSVGAWKKRGAPFAERLAPLLEDPDERIRDTVRYLLRR